MSTVSKDIAGITAQVNALNASMRTASKSPSGSGLDGNFLKNYADKAKAMRAEMHGMIATQGDFNIQSRAVGTHIDNLTEKLSRQKFGFRDLIKEHGNLKAVQAQQMQLQKSMVMQWGKTGDGKMIVDMFTPNSLKNMDSGLSGVKKLRSEVGFYNGVLSSVADQTVKWGKNTQWAGRQLMAGITMPIVAIGAATSVLAYQIDKGLTNVVKVYGDAATAATTTDAQIKSATLSTAKSLASAYGQSAKDSIEITSQLAAAGQTGMELQRQTAQVTRARTLGELNLNDAMSATITLQSVYGMSSQKLGETFNFMNAMENQTNLTMQDFVVGIPKVAGVLKEFNGTVQDAGVLLAGMKAGGIDAAEGANAIKSIAFKIINPNAGSKDMFHALTGSSFDDTMAGEDGVVNRLVKLGQVMKGLSEQQRVGLIQKMFGLYQGSKTLTLLSQLTDGSAQMTRAFEVARGSAADWADTANREMDKLTNAPWNKLKQQFETAKIALAEMGKSFLEMGAPILGFVNSILKGFNGMSPFTKRVAMLALGLAAVAGPLIMLAGLFGNLIGNLGKLTTFLVAVAAKTGIVTNEEHLSNIVRKQTEMGLLSEAGAYAALTKEITRTTEALQAFVTEELASKMSGAQAFRSAKEAEILASPGMLTPTNKSRMSGAKMAGNVVTTAAGGGPGTPKYLKAGTAAYGRAMDSTHAAALEINRLRMAEEKTVKEIVVAQQQVVGAQQAGTVAAANTVGKLKSASIFTKAAGVAGAAAMLSMVAPAGSVAEKIGGAAFAASILLPGFAKIPAAAKKVGEAMAKTDVGAKAMGKIGGVTKAIGGSLSGMLPIIGVIGGAFLAVGAAVGAAWYILHKHINQSKKESAAWADSAKTYADIFGFAYLSAGEGVDKTGQKVKNLNALLDEFKSKSGDAFKAYQHVANSTATEQQKINLAVNEGNKAYLHGADSAQAQKVAEVAAKGMGISGSDAQVAIKISAVADFSNMAAVSKSIVNNVQTTLDSAANDTFYRGMSEKLVGKRFSVTAQEQIKGSAENIWTVLNQTNKVEAGKALHDLEVMQNKINTAMADAANANKTQGAPQQNAMGFDIPQSQQSIKAFNDKTAAAQKDADAMTLLVQAEARLAGVSEKNIDHYKTMTDLMNLPAFKEAKDKYDSMTTAAAAWDSVVQYNASSTTKMTDKQMLYTLNLQRTSVGLENATTWQQGFNDAIDSGIPGIDQAAKALAAFNAERNRPQDNNMQFKDGQQLTDSLKAAYSTAMDVATSAASDIAQRAMSDVADAAQAQKDRLDAVDNAEKERLKNLQDSETKRLDALKKATEDSYDARIQKIKDSMDAEKAQEDLRQQMFEKEKTRIARMAETYNRNVDINAAINTGQFDTAAKLSNDQMAAQQGWNVDDQQSAEADKAKAREKALQDRIDSLEKGKTAAIDAIEAEKQATLDSIAAEGDAWDKNMKKRKDSLDASLKLQQQNAARELAIKKQVLDAQLTAIRASTPRNQAEYDAQIKKIQGAYKAYGVDLTRQGTGWGNVVGGALAAAVKNSQHAMSNEASWKALGAAAAAAMSQGAFSMTLPQFMKWVSTGEAPKGWTAEGAAKQSNQAINNRYSTGKYLLHEGGVVGGDNSSRAGYTGGMNPSEVNITALTGEAVLNRKATRSLGADNIDSLNKGQWNKMKRSLPPGTKKNIGGTDLYSGLGSVMAAAMAGSMKNAIQTQVLRLGMRAQQRDASGGFGSVFNAPGGFEAFFAAIAGQESGGNYSAVNSSSGALGKYQIMPANVGPWGQKYLGQSISPSAFLSDPALQERLARAVLGSYFSLYGARGAASAWYSGDPKLSESTASQNGYPSIKDYVDSVMAKMGAVSAIGGSSGLGWLRPVSGPETSPYGPRVSPGGIGSTFHQGVDFGVPVGTAIHASKGGRVAFAQYGWNGGSGNYTKIDHGNGVQTAYAHQSKINVSQGQAVSQGNVIGLSGNTGISTGPHLHFEYWKNGGRLNPNLLIPGLREGGFTMSDGLANLHKGETVVTAPLTEKFKDGIKNLDRSQSVRYDVNVDMRGAYIRDDLDVSNAVRTALMDIEKHKGAKRKVNG